MIVQWMRWLLESTLDIRRYAFSTNNSRKIFLQQKKKQKSSTLKIQIYPQFINSTMVKKQLNHQPPQNQHPFEIIWSEWKLKKIDCGLQKFTYIIDSWIDQYADLSQSYSEHVILRIWCIRGLLKSWNCKAVPIIISTVRAMLTGCK